MDANLYICKSMKAHFVVFWKCDNTLYYAKDINQRVRCDAQKLLTNVALYCLFDMVALTEAIISINQLSQYYLHFFNNNKMI